LDGYRPAGFQLDPDEWKYFITPQSVTQTVAEENARAALAFAPDHESGNAPDDPPRAAGA
jgi:hypothetical protein